MTSGCSDTGQSIARVDGPVLAGIALFPALGMCAAVVFDGQAFAFVEQVRPCDEEPSLDNRYLCRGSGKARQQENQAEPRLHRRFRRGFDELEYPSKTRNAIGTPGGERESVQDNRSYEATVERSIQEEGWGERRSRAARTSGGETARRGG